VTSKSNIYNELAKADGYLEMKIYSKWSCTYSEYLEKPTKDCSCGTKRNSFTCKV
jgi:hypothetical protein